MNEYIIMQGTISLFLPHSLSVFLPINLPDYLSAHSAPFVQIKGGWMEQGEILFLFTRIHFEEKSFFFSVCLKALVPFSLAAQSRLFLLPSLTGCLPLYLSSSISQFCLCAPVHSSITLTCK